MNHNFLSAFVLCGAVGLGCVALPRLVAPSDTYISDSLEPVTTKAPFEFTVQPSDFVAVDGENVSFNVAVSQFSTVVTYLWQYATAANPDLFIDIPNSNLSVYNFISDSSFDGYTYRCIASYDGDTIISDLATLNILPVTTSESEVTTIEENT